MMRGIILYADGSPCPTLTLPAEEFPGDEPALCESLRRLRDSLPETERTSILKFALVAPDRTADSDLTYRFVQCLPGRDPLFEFRGSCGHSILAAAVGAARFGYLPRPEKGHRIKVHVLNNDDRVTCDIVNAAAMEVVSTVTFRRPRPPLLSDLLLFGEPVTDLGNVEVSAVSLGNPYVFVDASAVGHATRSSLFSGGSALFQELSAIREAAERRLGWSPGAFPKIAAVLGTPAGIAVRAISVPSWHPSLALTGAVCLAAAVALPGTIPARLAGAPDGPLTITTPGGETVVAASTHRTRLGHVQILGQRVRLLHEISLCRAAIPLGARG